MSSKSQSAKKAKQVVYYSKESNWDNAPELWKRHSGIREVFEFWEDQLPGTGLRATNPLGFLAVENPTFSLKIEAEFSREMIRKMLHGDLSRGMNSVFTNDVRLVKTTEVDPNCVTTYVPGLRRWAEEKIENLHHFFHCSGSLGPVVWSMFTEDCFDRIPIFSQSSLKEKFITDIQNSTDKSVLKRLNNNSKLCEVFAACVCAAIVGSIVGAQEASATSELMNLWMEGLFPIGLDMERRLLILHV